MRRSSSFLLKNLISTALVKVAAPLMIPPGLSQQDVKKTVSYFSSFGNNAFFKPNTDFAIITTEPAEQLWDDFHPDKSDHLPWRFSLGKDANGQEMFALIENVLMRCRKIERDGKVFFNNGKGEEETEEKFIIRRNKTDDDTWDVLKSDPRYVVVFRAEDYNTKKQRDKSAARFKSKKVPGWENPVFITEEDEEIAFGLTACFKNGPIAEAFQLDENLAEKLGDLAVRCQTFRPSASYQISNVHVPHDGFRGYNRIIFSTLSDNISPCHKIEDRILYLKKSATGELQAFSNKLKTPIILEKEILNKLSESGFSFTDSIKTVTHHKDIRKIVSVCGFEKDKFFVTSKSECKRMYRIIFNDMMTTLDEDGFMLRHVVNDKNITPDEEIIAIKEAYVETLEELHSSEQSRFPVKVIVRITPSLDGHKKLIGEKNINENENSQARFTVDTAAEITMFKSDKDQFHYIPKNKMHCLFGLLVGGGSLQLLGQKGAIDAEAVVVAGFASEMHHVADVHQQLRM